MIPDTIASRIGELRISVATVVDAPAIRQLRNDLARWMLHEGIEQWHPGEMSLQWIETCISWGAVHVVTHDDHLVGSVTIVWDDPFVWGDRPAAAGFVHMLMVERGLGGHGIGGAILAWAEASILDTGRVLARLDCVRSNERLRAYYEAAGYRVVAYKEFPGVEGAGETALYEKSLVADA